MKAIRLYVRERLGAGRDPGPVALVWQGLVLESELLTWLCAKLAAPQVDRRLFGLLDVLLAVGKPLSLDALVDLKLQLGVRPEPEAQRVRARLSELIDAKPAIMARWAASPWSSMLEWVPWGGQQVAAILTELCEPVLRLRAYEFSADARKRGPNLVHLLEMAQSVAQFVTSSILVAAAESKKKAMEVLIAWVDVTQHLLSMASFHMLQAVYLGLTRHQVERIPWLWKRLPARLQKHLKLLDGLYDPKDRYMQLTGLYQARIDENKPLVICLPVLAQRALLLEESPLLVERRLNPERVQATWNIFQILARSQQLWYPKSAIPDEKRLWYFMQLPQNKKKSKSVEDQDNDLYALSDAAVNQTVARSRSAQQISMEAALEVISGSESESESCHSSRSERGRTFQSESSSSRDALS